MNRFVIVALLLHIPLFAYPVLRLSQWSGLSYWLTLLLFLPIFFSQIFARRVLRDKTGPAVFFLRNSADFMLGAAPIFLIVLLVAELLLLFFDIERHLLAMIVIVVSTGIILKGVSRALTPDLVTINLSSSKLTKPVRFVQISDVHVGSRSSRFLERTLETIAKQRPDFLCITGDFIDQPGITVKQLSSLSRFDAPIYYTIGNHERYEDLDDILARLSSLGVIVLRNETVMHETLQLIGIDDAEDALQVPKHLANIDISDGFSILLYHRPVGLEACHMHGVELMLSGHTHGGQIIPFNLIVSRVFERVKGLFYFGDSTLYVSEGTGTWGPMMRVGTRSEITIFELSPTS